MCSELRLQLSAMLLSGGRADSPKCWKLYDRAVQARTGDDTVE